MRTTGVVEWFSDAKGFGFIKPDDEGEGCFVHYSEIQSSGFQNLTEGARVEFDLLLTSKGPRATGVRSLESPYNEAA